MLSRVADNLYWFSRYVRRAENTARLVGVGSLLQLDLPRSVRFAWRPMVDTVGAGDGFAAGLVSALLEGLPLAQAVRRGNRVGAFAIQVAGDMEGLPNRAELNEYNALPASL